MSSFWPIFLSLVIIWGLLTFLTFIYKRIVPPQHKNKLELPLSNEIKCPTCHCPLEIVEMLNAAVFFGPGAIVFDCKNCHDRVYFSPYEDFIETGVLGCSPVVDAIPVEKFSYPNGFDMTSSTQNGILEIKINEHSWAIPRYGLR